MWKSILTSYKCKRCGGFLIREEDFDEAADGTFFPENTYICRNCKEIYWEKNSFDGPDYDDISDE